jgi:hypothetical protein
MGFRHGNIPDKGVSFEPDGTDIQTGLLIYQSKGIIVGIAEARPKDEDILESWKWGL